MCDLSLSCQGGLAWNRKGTAASRRRPKPPWKGRGAAEYLRPMGFSSGILLLPPSHRCIIAVLLKTYLLQDIQQGHPAAAKEIPDIL